MKLTGLHLLLTYQCTLECDHCFVWGSPRQSGTMTLENIRETLRQAKELGTIKSIYFEGGEPFLYYATLLAGTREAQRAGFSVGVVSNAYWATSVEDAMEWLKPFAGLLNDLSVSSDLYHYNEAMSRQAKNASAAAKQLGIPLGVIEIAQPQVANPVSVVANHHRDSHETTIEIKRGDDLRGQLPRGESGVMYRGRAVAKLATGASKESWIQFTKCPHEDLRDPGRIHLDPLGHLQICQGISIGNLFQTPLREICETYDPDAHPIVGALLSGGPAELTRHYDLAHAENYADACHLCYESRILLRGKFPEILNPDQTYGI